LVGVFMIGLLVSQDDDRLLHGTSKTAQSPWVIAIQNAGIGSLPSVINAALLTSAVSWDFISSCFGR
jgi:amino acid transporter